MNEWDALKWRDFDDLRRDSSCVPETPGVYAVRSVRRGKPRVIGRAFGRDKSGILCFGMTDRRTLKERLTEFCAAASGGRAPHAEGKTYHRLRYNENGYPLASLEIAWVDFGGSGAQGKAKLQEKAWFLAYEKTFGELPPLNKQCG